MLCGDKHNYRAKHRKLNKYFYPSFLCLASRNINFHFAAAFQKQAKPHLMHFLNAQFGSKASAVIIYKALTNVQLCSAELTSVYFGQTLKIFTANEYESRQTCPFFLSGVEKTCSNVTP